MAKEYTKGRVLAFLNDNKVSYDVQEHGAVHTMADVDSAGVQRKGIALKNLFLKDRKGTDSIALLIVMTILGAKEILMETDAFK